MIPPVPLLALFFALMYEKEGCGINKRMKVKLLQDAIVGGLIEVMMIAYVGVAALLIKV